MIYNLHIQTWVGLSLDASHWWGNIESSDQTVGKGIGNTGQFKRYFSREEVIAAARRWFASVRKTDRKAVLLEGLAAYLDPKPCLAAPRGVARRLNQVYFAAKRNGFWEGDEKKMKAICAQWDRILRPYL